MGPADWPVIRHIVALFGYVMRGIYLISSYFGIENVAFCIVMFVIVSKIALSFSSYRNEKQSVLSPKLKPRIDTIVAKYKDKLDHPLAKNKLNIDKGYYLYRFNLLKSNGCLMSVLQIPLLFSLYAVIKNVPRFVPELNLMTPEQLNDAYSFFGWSINDTPGLKLSSALIFPVLACVLQLMETLQTTMNNKKSSKGTESVTIEQQKAIKIAPIISNVSMLAFTFYFSATFPIFCSIYWIVRSIMTLIITFVFRGVLSKVPLEYYEKKHLNKINKNRVKRDLPVLLEC